jgi:hypothetical protein
VNHVSATSAGGDCPLAANITSLEAKAQDLLVQQSHEKILAAYDLNKYAIVWFRSGTVNGVCHMKNKCYQNFCSDFTLACFQKWGFGSC